MIFSPLIGRFSGSSSLGLIVSSTLILFYYFSKKYLDRLGFRDLYKIFFITLAFFALIFFHAFLSTFFVVEDLFINRLFLSGLAGFIVISSAFIFFLLFDVVDQKKIISIMSVMWKVTLILALTIFLRFSEYSPFNTYDQFQIRINQNLIGSDNFIDHLQIFSEPSHFVIIFLPIYLYKFFITRGLSRFMVIIFGFMFAFSIQSATFLLCLFFLIIWYLINVHLRFTLYALIFLIVTYFFGSSIFGNNFNFFNIHDSKNFFLDKWAIIFENESLDLTNISVLGALADWKEGYSNFISTYGFGIGFQQHGLVGERTYIKDVIQSLSGDYEWKILLETFSVAPKLISEFGFFGLVAILLYIKSFFKIIYSFRINTLNPSYNLDHKHLIMISFFMCYLVSLFVRGTGYFTVSSFFLFIACLYIFSLNRKFNLKLSN